MKTKTEESEVIANHDAAGNTLSQYLHHGQSGAYFLRTEKLQIRKGRSWIDHPADGSARNLPQNAVRWNKSEQPMTENEAIDWYLATAAPKPLARAIQRQIGHLVSLELGDLAKPFAVACRCREMQNAITLLQAAIAKRFGTEFDTGSGAGVLHISHDEVCLSNQGHTIVAEDAGSVARQLSARRHR